MMQSYGKWRICVKYHSITFLCMKQVSIHTESNEITPSLTSALGPSRKSTRSTHNQIKWYQGYNGQYNHEFGVFPPHLAFQCCASFLEQEGRLVQGVCFVNQYFDTFPTFQYPFDILNHHITNLHEIDTLEYMNLANDVHKAEMP